MIQFCIRLVKKIWLLSAQLQECIRNHEKYVETGDFHPVTKEESSDVDI